MGGKVPCIVQWNAITAQEWLAINRGEEEASNKKFHTLSAVDGVVTGIIIIIIIVSIIIGNRDGNYLGAQM